MTTRLEKLAAMARADESPHEAAIARAKLAEMGAGRRLPPTRPPGALPTPEPDEWLYSYVNRAFDIGSSTSSNGTTVTWTWNP